MALAWFFRSFELYLGGPAYVAPMALAVSIRRSARMVAEPLNLCATVDRMPQAESV